MSSHSELLDSTNLPSINNFVVGCRGGKKEEINDSSITYMSYQISATNTFRPANFSRQSHIDTVDLGQRTAATIKKDIAVFIQWL